MSSDKAEKAVRDLTSDYYDSVRAIAKEADDLIRERGLQDPEDFDAWLHETCDGNYWVTNY